MTERDILQHHVATLVRQTPLQRIIDPARAGRAACWAAVGATGTVVDLVVTVALLGPVHYLVANLVGFLCAVSWNFTLNWRITYGRPEGTLWKQYASYVGLHGVTFAGRVLVIALLVEALGVPALFATVVGVGVAAVLNFAGAESILQSDRELWFDAVGALNAAAHFAYTGRVRSTLQRIGLYDAVYTAYTVVLGLLYRGDTYPIAVDNATATLTMYDRSVVASVLHSVEKERDALALFLDEVQAGDVVWDVGANVGVYALLAADVARSVVAIEPLEENVLTLLLNTRQNDVGDAVEAYQIALGATTGKVWLSVPRSEAGAQRPAVGAGAERRVEQTTGDALVDDGERPPDVLKIDVEGGELEVLRGCESLLPCVRVVFVECHDTSEAVTTMLQDSAFETERLRMAGQGYVIGRRR